MAPIQEGATNVPQQTFQHYNDPSGNKLVAINRDGTIFVQGINFPDGSSATSAGSISADVDGGTF